MKYTHLLFDADNTLFDFGSAERRALAQTLADVGCPCDGVTEPLYHAVNQALWQRFNRGGVGREELLVERFAVFCRVLGRDDDPAALNRRYLDHLSRCAQLIPGALALCRALAPHYTLAIVTNGNARAQRGRFFASPLAEVIPWLFISEEIGFQKPQPEFFRAVLDRLSVRDLRRAVVIGDDPNSDILGGMRSGLDTIWYHPDGTPPPAGVTPTATVSSLAELGALLLPVPSHEIMK